MEVAASLKMVIGIGGLEVRDGFPRSTKSRRSIPKPIQTTTKGLPDHLPYPASQKTRNIAEPFLEQPGSPAAFSPQ